MKSLTSSIPPHLHELQYSIRFFWRLFQVFQEEKNCLRVFGGTLVVAGGVLYVARGLDGPL